MAFLKVVTPCYPKLFADSMKKYETLYSKSVRVRGNVSMGFTNLKISQDLCDKYYEHDSYIAYVPKRNAWRSG